MSDKRSRQLPQKARHGLRMPLERTSESCVGRLCTQASVYAYQPQFIVLRQILSPTWVCSFFSGSPQDGGFQFGIPLTNKRGTKSQKSHSHLWIRTKLVDLLDKSPRRRWSSAWSPTGEGTQFFARELKPSVQTMKPTCLDLFLCLLGLNRNQEETYFHTHCKGLALKIWTLVAGCGTLTLRYPPANKHGYTFGTLRITFSWIQALAVACSCLEGVIFTWPS